MRHSLRHLLFVAIVATPGGRGVMPPTTGSPDVSPAMAVVLHAGDHCADCEVTNGPVYNPDTQSYIWWLTTGGPCGEGNPDCIDCNKIEGFVTQCFHNEFVAFSPSDSTSPCDDEFCEDVSREAAKEAAAAFNASDARRLANLLATSNTLLFLNAERSAIQGFGCKGRVALHLQLSAALLAEVQAMLEAMPTPTAARDAVHSSS
jgi:hypothetical protein